MPKPNRYEDRLSRTIPPSDGMERSFSQKTPLHLTRGRMGFSCAFCGLEIACMATKSVKANNHYCSRSCLGKAKSAAGRVNVKCFICNVKFLKIKSKANATDVHFCSKECARLKWDNSKWQLLRGRDKYVGLNTKRWRADRNKIISRNECEICKTTTTKLWTNCGGRLLCQNCHLKDIAPLGSIARDSKKTNSGSETCQA